MAFGTGQKESRPVFFLFFSFLFSVTCSENMAGTAVCVMGNMAIVFIATRSVAYDWN